MSEYAKKKLNGKKVRLGMLICSALFMSVSYADLPIETCQPDLGITSGCEANETLMKETLVKIIQQLQAIQPLIVEAKLYQPANPRVMVHFNSWVDGSGVRQNGLMEDVEAIQKSLIDVVNQENIEPAYFAPINSDFVTK